MGIDINKNINGSLPKAAGPNVSGTRVTRSLQEIGNLLGKTSGKERSDIDKFKFDSFSPADPELQKADDLKHVKETAQKTAIRNQQLVLQANQNASALLLKAALTLDPGLSEFPKKGSEGKSPEEAQKIIEQNIKKLINGPDNVKTLGHIAAKISEKLGADKNKSLESKNESDSTNPENQELLANLEDVINSGSHEEVQAFLEKLKGANPQLLKQLKPLIKSYKDSLAAVFRSEEKNISNLDELKKNPLYKDGIEFKNDKALRNLFAQLAGQIIDQKGGIFNYRDDDVTWALLPFEHKPGANGRTVTDLEIRRLLPVEIAGNSRTYTTVALNENNPTYSMMQQA